VSDANVGITIHVSAGELKTLIGRLNETDKTARKAGEGGGIMGRAFARAQKEFGAVGRSLIVFNQALGIAEKAFKVLSKTVERFFTEGLEFRFEDDSVIRAVDSISKSFNRARNSAIGTLAPLLTGIANVVGPLAKSFEKFVQANEKAIRTGIIEWAAKLSTALVSGVAFGVQAVVKAWMGWQLIIAGTQSLANKGFDAMLRGMARVIEESADLQHKLGLMDKQDWAVLKLGAVEMRLLAQEFASSGRNADKELNRITKDLEKTEGGIDKVKQAMLDGIKNTAVEAMKHLGVATHTATENAADLAKAAEDAAKAQREAEIAHMIATNDATVEALKARERMRLESSERQLDTANEFAKRERDLIVKSIETQISSGGIDGLIGAWRTYFETREKLDQDQSAEMLDRLNDTTAQMADRIASSVTDIVNTVASELRRIGDIETETVERIAIKSTRVVNGATGETAEVVERYVDGVTQQEIEALERMGKTAEVVTDTIAIRTRSVADAVKSIFMSLFEQLGSMLLSFVLKTVAIMTLSGLTGGGSIGFGSALKMALGFSGGGKIPGMANGGLIQRAANGLLIGGGKPGQDSVLIAGMPGERVLNVPETKAYDQTYPKGILSGPQARATSGGKSERPIVVVGPPSRGGLRRLLRDEIVPENNLLARYGVLKTRKA
jgi:hypothetical protein